MIYTIYLNIFIKVLILNVYNLIGPIGSGKSEVQKILEESNQKCFCADHYVRNLYKDTQIINQIKKICPIIIENEEVNTNSLRELVFNDINKMREIESYIQPKVFDKFNKLIKNYKNEDKIFFVIPVIKNNKFIKKHKTIYLDANINIRKKRLEKRKNYNENIINKIIEYQLSIDKYKSNSDYYIENNSSILNLKNNIKKILMKL